MSEQQHKPAGLLVGVLGGANGQPIIGISVSGEVTVAMSVDNAGMVFEQLGFILEQLGYFDDEGGCETCANKDECEEATCRTKH